MIDQGWPENLSPASPGRREAILKACAVVQEGEKPSPAIDLDTELSLDLQFHVNAIPEAYGVHQARKASSSTPESGEIRDVHTLRIRGGRLHTLKVQTSLRLPPYGSDDGAPPPQQRPRSLQIRSISPEKRNLSDSPGRESDRGRLWCPLGWRRAVIGAGQWRTEGRPCVASANVTRCVEREREALLAIKQDLLVVNSSRLSSWGTAAKDCCKWEGVLCDHLIGHVIQLHLRGWVLSSQREFEDYIPFEGKLSSKLIELQQLAYIDLSSNYLRPSPIPGFIGSLFNLRYLDLFSSGFDGEIPYRELGNLTHLQYLDLSSSDFTNAIEFFSWLAPSSFVSKILRPQFCESQ
ncbi:hypothetical protein ACLB2K_069294 [Fragaria x ananassa]